MDMLNTVKTLLTDISSVSPLSEQLDETQNISPQAAQAWNVIYKTLCENGPK